MDLKWLALGWTPDAQFIEVKRTDSGTWYRPEGSGVVIGGKQNTISELVPGKIYEVRHVDVSDLVIQGFRRDGVNAHDSAFHTTLLGLTCRGNGRSGVSVGGASRVKVIGCLVGNNGRAQVRTEGFSRTEIVNCDLIDAEHAPATVRQGGQLTIQDDAAGP